MSRSTRLAILSAVAALVGACAAGGPVVQPSGVYSGYTPQLLDYAASQGGMPLEVIGNPFQTPKQDLDVAIAETMAKSHFGQHVQFLTVVPADFASPYRVVVALNAVPGTSAYKLCAGGVEIRPRGPGDPDRVHAALCARDEVITSVNGHVFGPTGPRDPSFVHLIGQTSLALFPPYDPNRRDGRDNDLIIGFLGGPGAR